MNGKVSHLNRTVDSVAMYTCNGLFEIVGGNEMRTCQNDSTWNGTAANCSGEYSTPGIWVLKITSFPIPLGLHHINNVRVTRMMYWSQVLRCRHHLKSTCKLSEPMHCRIKGGRRVEFCLGKNGCTNI